MLRLFPFVFSFVAFLSCNQLVKMTDDSYYQKVDPVSGAEDIKIVFSHNINGETHPCGCRKFPLGGLPQVAGYLAEAKKSSPVVYVDTGDMLFPSPSVPESMRESISFTAKKLAEAQEMLGLDYFLPGDQDFALGTQYLEELSKGAKFDFLITNLKNSSKIKAKKYAVVKAGGRKVVLLGVVDPSLLNSEARKNFSPIQASLKSAIKEIKAKKELTNAPIILLSHAGLEADKHIAKKFQELDWVIGSHSQSFLRFPEEVGRTKIAQGLSRNHYLGEISVPYNIEKKYSYRLVAMDEGMEKKIDSNPLIPWLAGYKSKLDGIQESEQRKLAADVETHEQKYGTYLSCKECHQPQSEFWQGTAHALAWQTLEKAQATNNPQCVGCHSLGFQDPKGFIASSAVVQGEALSDKKLEKYWNEVNSVFHGTGSVREMSSAQRKGLSEKWMKVDAKHGVEKNFANVQCLNCHSKHPEHPFNIEDGPKQESFSNRCLSCHTADQSPDWYLKDDAGLATKPNKKYVERKIKAVACPKM